MKEKRANLVTPEQLKDYLQRDWSRLEKASHVFWRKRLRELGPDEGLRAADELRQQARAAHPNWPDQAARQEDL